MKKLEVARLVEQVDMTPGKTYEEMKRFCEDAITKKIASVCVLPIHVPSVVNTLRGTGVKVCALISFPLGMDTKEVKFAETSEAIGEGAAEIEMVINVGAAKGGDKKTIDEELKGVVEESHKNHCLLKAIIEMPLLDQGQAVNAACWAGEAGADFVVTSTGYAGLKLRVTTVEDVKLLRHVLAPSVAIKAAVGIQNMEIVLAMIEAGAGRVGVSSVSKLLV